MKINITRWAGFESRGQQHNSWGKAESSTACQQPRTTSPSVCGHLFIWIHFDFISPGIDPIAPPFPPHLRRK